jgi:hypothetical protein
MRALNDDNDARRWIDRMANEPHFCLSSIPESEKTYENCLYAVKHCRRGQNIFYVPMHFRTAELCWEATKLCGQNIEDVPEELRTYELCQIAVRQDGICLEYVPEELLDIGLYRLAIESGNLNAFYHIPQGPIMDQLQEEYPNFFDI